MAALQVLDSIVWDGRVKNFSFGDMTMKELQIVLGECGESDYISSI